MYELHTPLTPCLHVQLSEVQYELPASDILCRLCR